MTTEQAELIATTAINNYFNEKAEPFQAVGEVVTDYSCNECEFDAYLCPHLNDRLKKHIVNELVKL